MPLKGDREQKLADMFDKAMISANVAIAFRSRGLKADEDLLFPIKMRFEMGRQVLRAEFVAD